MSAPDARTGWRIGAAVALVVAVVATIALVVRLGSRPEDTAGDGAAALRTSAPPASPSPEPTPSVRASARAATPAEPDAPAPTRIRIPDLDVDATVRPVGVQDDGAMVIPAAPTSVGWYRYGRAPSDPTGHTVLQDSIRLQAGDGDEWNLPALIHCMSQCSSFRQIHQGLLQAACAGLYQGVIHVRLRDHHDTFLTCPRSMV